MLTRSILTPINEHFLSIKVTSKPDKDGKDDRKQQSKLVVRGYGRCAYHADIFDELQQENENEQRKLELECLGGGRIEHDAERKSIRVYGYSQVRYGSDQ